MRNFKLLAVIGVVVLVVSSIAVFVAVSGRSPASVDEKFSYAELPIPSKDFFVLAMSGGSKNHKLGCALFRKTPPGNSYEWGSAQFLKSNIWMILARKNSTAQGLQQVDLYIDDEKIKRPVRHHKTTLYYLDLIDFKKVLFGKTLFHDASHQQQILSTDDARKMQAVLAQCLPEARF